MSTQIVQTGRKFITPEDLIRAVEDRWQATPCGALQRIIRAQDELIARLTVRPKQASSNESKRRICVEEADRIGRELEIALGAEFYRLSQRRQAELIGCHWKTWKETDFFTQTHPARPEKNKSRPPRAISLTPELAATIGEEDSGDREEELFDLINE